MALFSRRVADILDAAFLVAPAPERRQLTLARITVRRLGNNGHGVNVLVLPVPCSALRSTVVLDARLPAHQHAFDDLHASFGHTVATPGEATATAAYHASSNRLRLCANVDELRHVRMDGVALRLPEELVATAERHYGLGFAFVVCVFRIAKPVTRLFVAYTHPLVRNALYLPMLAVAPRGVPFGERPSIAIDDAPEWAARHVAVYSLDTASECGQSLRRSNVAFVPTRLGLGGATPTSVRCRLTCATGADSLEWLPLSSVYHGLLQVRSCIDCGDLPEAERTLRAMLKRKRKSALLRATLGQVCGLRGYPGDAKDLFEQALLDEPENHIAMAMYGRHLQDAGKKRKAALAYRRALEIHPNDAASLIGLAMCTSPAHEPLSEEAATMLSRALQLDPTRRDAALLLEQSPSALSLEQAHAMAIDADKERDSVRDHFDIYFDHLNEESKRIFVKFAQ